VTLERLGQVAERQHDLVDAVPGQPGQLALQERDVDDRQERLRRVVRQRPEPRPLPTDEDDRLHGFAVVAGAVVGVLAAGVLAAGVLDGTVAVPAGIWFGLSMLFAAGRFDVDGGSPSEVMEMPGGRNAITIRSLLCGV